MNRVNKTKYGYAIMELLFYIVFFTILSFVVINAMIVMTQSFRENAIEAEWVQSGTIMERMTREIRAASTATVSLNDLVLNSYEFQYSSPNVVLVGTGNLNTPNISVTALTFTQITTTKGKAVKIAMTIKANDDPLARTQDFYDTIVLRGAY